MEPGEHLGSLIGGGWWRYSSPLRPQAAPARSLRVDGLVTYDEPMADAAGEVSITVVSPTGHQR